MASIPQSESPDAIQTLHPLDMPGCLTTCLRSSASAVHPTDADALRSRFGRSDRGWNRCRVRRQYGLGITLCTPRICFLCRSQWYLVVDLPVLHQPATMLRADRLVRQCQIDDRESRVAESTVIVSPRAHAIRAAMLQRGGHPAHQGGIPAAQRASDAAHRTIRVGDGFQTLHGKVSGRASPVNDADDQGGDERDGVGQHVEALRGGVVVDILLRIHQVVHLKTDCKGIDSASRKHGSALVTEHDSDEPRVQQEQQGERNEHHHPVVVYPTQTGPLCGDGHRGHQQSEP